MGMISLRKPSADTVRRFLTGQAGEPFTYPAVGATSPTAAETIPPGYVVDHTRVRLGEGEPVYEAAKAALRRWEQFRLGWVEACPTDTPVHPGEVVAVLGRGIGLWWMNACRVVYRVDESGPVETSGFGYGTLPGHVEKGEERFLLEWDRETDAVWYDILAFSRPNHVLTWIGYPVVRRKQKRFGRESAAAVFRAVGGSARLPEIAQATR